ncbi:hypothetical protein CDAR_184821 [Caerostris darwini]|uniref:Uncharacterized protein n=1 Tax=Caerostris darwini TaxID=1538125 RepID=A0AAV4SPE1_9ARAC|nr:hypothetical protein CDAR_184821 [Caerostris darwini]
MVTPRVKGRRAFSEFLEMKSKQTPERETREEGAESSLFDSGVDSVDENQSRSRSAVTSEITAHSSAFRVFLPLRNVFFRFRFDKTLIPDHLRG